MQKILLFAIFIVICSFSYCQVSYDSKVVQDNSYIAPVDLGIMQQVLTQKQNNYNNNIATIQERFKSCQRLMNYIGDLNKQLFIDQYNRIADYTNQADLSDPNTVNYINQKLDRFDYLQDYTLKNPNYQLNSSNF